MVNRDWSGITSRTLIVFALLAIAISLVYFTIPLIYPFIIGWMIAMIIEPLVGWLERHTRTPRWLAVTILLVLLLSSIFSLVIFVSAKVVVELTHLADSLPPLLSDMGQRFMDFFTRDTSIHHMIETIQSYLEKNPHHRQQISSSIQDHVVLFANKGTQLITSILSTIGTFLGNLPFFLTVLVFITLAAFFIGFDWPRLREKGIGLLPSSIKSTSGLVFQDMKRALFGFLRAQFTLITITALLMFAGLIILRVPYALTIALIIGLIDLLPYLGVGIIVVPWIIYLFFIGNVHLAVGLSIIYGIILIVRQFMEPKLVASHVGLDPLLTLIALFAGLQLFGFLGLILGPILLVIILALYKAHFFQDIWGFIMNRQKI